MLRTLFTTLSRSDSMRRLAGSFAPARRFARRFTAGEALEEGLEKARELNGCGMAAALNYLGESVETEEDARRAAREYKGLIRRIREEGLDASVSLKPSHLGLGFGREFYRENVADVLQAGRSVNFPVEMDMEDASTVSETLAVFHSLLEDYGNLRIALQACLFRTAKDLETLIEKGVGVRLVKGAYDESSDVAWKKKSDVDLSYARLIEESFSDAALRTGFHPAFGTHDHLLMDRIRTAAESRGVNPDRFEFQMLLGVRRDWQQRLKEAGFCVRIYVPFGTQWYPYFMRRLAERPANVLFAVRAISGR